MQTDTNRLGKNVAVVAVVVALVLSPAISGLALGAEVQRGGQAGQYDPGVGGANNVQISDDKPVVFQGERNIEFLGPEGFPLDAGQLVGVAGNAEGVPLESPIPQDQERGQYTTTGESDAPGVTIQTPRVTELDLLNERGIDVGGANVQEDETLLVRAEWNFEQSEDLELVVRDQNGNTVTGDVLADADQLSDAQRNELSGPYADLPERVVNPGQRGTGTGVVYLQGLGQFSDGELANSSELDAAYWALDVSDLQSGDLSITVEGWDDLNFGAASQTTTVNVQSEDDVNLDLEDEGATRGQNVLFTVRGSTAGASHYVAIEDDDFRNNRVDVRVFRDIQDVIDRGTVDVDGDGTDDFAYAEIEVNEDTGLGVGQVDTGYLDDASVTVNLYSADRSLEDVAADIGDTEDDQTLDVRQGDLTFDSPDGTYVAGSEVDLRGQAAQGVDDVAVYARDQGDWELVDVNEDGSADGADTISVDSTGEWERDDVVLSEATDIFSIPGRYRIGVVEVEDVQTDDGELASQLSTSEFSSATSSQTAIIVQEPGLEEARTFQAINGQVAVEDGTVDVEGVAPGLDEVLAILVDSRGRIATERITVDDDDSFEEDDVSMVTRDGRTLNEGQIRALVVGLGRDSLAGDGILPGQTSADLAGLEDYVQGLRGGLTQQQVISLIADETTDEVASDDLSIQEAFRFTDGAVSIDTVAPADENATVGEIQTIEVGETMFVQGVTNRKPDDNTITVEVIDGPSIEEFDADSTDAWPLTGVWSVSLSTDGVEPGTYTLEADDGDNTDTVTVEVVAPGAGDAAGNDTDTGNETTTAPGNDTDAGNGTDAGNETTTAPGNGTDTGNGGGDDAGAGEGNETNADGNNSAVAPPVRLGGFPN